MYIDFVDLAVYQTKLFWVQKLTLMMVDKVWRVRMHNENDKKWEWGINGKVNEMETPEL